MDVAAFKRSIRDLQIWCSSCMVAFAGGDPIGVLIGAKRPTGTLIHRIAVHPDHVRQGHGRHLLTSLSSKLAILGPPRIVAEVPEELAPARALFEAAGYVEEAVLTDYALETEEGPAAPSLPGRMVIPITVDDLAANGVFGEAYPQTSWERSLETLTATKDEIDGVAVASEDQIEAFILYVRSGDGAGIVSLRSLIDDGGARLKLLLSRLGGLGTLRFPKVHPAELSQGLLETLGFHSTGGHRLFATRARSE
jgi:hypothetical protein